MTNVIQTMLLLQKITLFDLVVHYARKTPARSGVLRVVLHLAVKEQKLCKNDVKNNFFDMIIIDIKR